MRQDSRDDFQAWLWGEILLFGLLGSSLALFVSNHQLQTNFSLPQLGLVLQTVMAFAGGIIALLAGIRFAVEGRRLDLFLCTGFLIASVSIVAFAIAPVLDGQPVHRAEAWACVVLVLGWLALRSSSAVLPGIDPRSETPGVLTGTLAAQALLNLLAVVGFGKRFFERREDLDRWLALGSTLMLFASLHYVFTPVLAAGSVSRGDALRLLAYGLLLAGAWRAISYAEFGRAVAEERARVAREIHDGLAQYLFAISTHASMLQNGAPQAETIAKLREAANAAQQEARFAILALSTAAGTAQFDAALRRYIEFLTADGQLEVDLEIDVDVRLAPDEQIELFRIVQEGLANVRKHANATREEGVIGMRNYERFVLVHDDGEGFDGESPAAGQGLKNIRARTKTIEGGFTLTSKPGLGTALEVVLRT